MSSIGVLEDAAAGKIRPNQKWPPYKDAYANGSPWSIAIACIPVTAPINQWLPQLHAAPPHAIEGKTEPLSSSISSFVEQECTRWGWVEDRRETPASQFIKTRLRQSDAYCHSLSWDPQETDPWYVGIVKVLAQLRKIDGSDISLADFEAMGHSEALDMLLPSSTLRADVLERVSELALPYAKYTGTLNILTDQWLATQQLDTLIPLRDIPEFQDSLRIRALANPPSAWRTVQTVVPTLSDIASAAQVLVDVNAAPETFEDIVRWRDSASTNVQLDVIIRYLQHQKNWKKTNNDLAILRKVLTKPHSDDVHREVIKYALEGSRFMFLQHQLSSLDQAILREDVLKLVKQVGTDGVTLQQAETAAALLKPAPKEVSQIIEAAKACAAYGIEPSASLVQRNPLDIIRLAIAAKPDAYESPRALMELAEKVCPDPANRPTNNEVAEQCVETALANDDFTVALKLCQRLIDSSADDSGAWLAFLHLGKYVSSSWDSPRPFSVLQTQQRMLSRCLVLCPAGDIPTVLSSFKTLEDEMTMIDEADSLDESSSNASRSDGLQRESSSTPDPTERRPRDLQNLLVSGIGWAIGAPPVRD